MISFQLVLRLKRTPGVSFALPPVGVHTTLPQFPHITCDDAWLKTVILFVGGQNKNKNKIKEYCAIITFEK
jgi:hypothetical protein